jgi:hypothetical protein
MGGMFSVFNKSFRNQETRCLMLRLDAAGKTTILCKKKLGEHVTTIPMIGFDFEIVEYNDWLGQRVRARESAAGLPSHVASVNKPIKDVRVFSVLPVKKLACRTALTDLVR